MKREKCANCGGTLIPKKIDYDKMMGEKRVLFEGVPALVCPVCDEVWLEGKVAEKLEKIFRRGIRATRWLKIPICSYSKAA